MNFNSVHKIEVEVKLMGSLVTWDVLTTYAGSVAFVTMCTQLLKFYVPKADPKWVALALTILLNIIIHVVYIQDYSLNSIVLSIFNIVSILFGAIGAFETMVKPIQRKATNRT